MTDKERIVFTKPECEAEENIRHFLKRRGVSTSLIAKVKYGCCHLNGNEVHMRAVVAPGDTVEIYLPIENSDGIKPIDIPLDIVYEDEWLLVVNKPINMPVHPSKGNSLPTLANAVSAYLNQPFVFRAANRLDRDTSGLVIIAKNQLSSAILCRTVKERELKKLYYALVVGTPQESGIIDAPIMRETEGAMKRIVHPDGKESLTEYKLVECFANGTSLCEISPITGRTHQIRVHMAHIGHPLYNDFLYGQRVNERSTYFLHCGRLIFPHPISGETLDLYRGIDKTLF